VRCLQYEFVAIGSPVYDIIQTPNLSTRERILSGCATNALLAMKKLGANRIGFVGSVGKDSVDRVKADLFKRGITDMSLKLSEQTGGFRLVYDSKGDRTLDILGVPGKILPEDIPTQFLETRYLLLGPILQEVDFELVSFISKSTSATIFLDPQGMLRRVEPDGRIVHSCDRHVMKRIVALTDFVKPNEVESVVLTEETNPYRAARILVDWGARAGIVTLAERGSTLCYDNELLSIPAYPTVAIDPTGAGDVYAGSFIFEYCKTNDLRDSAVFASAAASVMVENVGPDFPLSEDEARRRSKLIKDLVAGQR